MSAKKIVVLEEWPKECMGGCRRMLRPSHEKAKDWPGTIASVLIEDPWCAKCRWIARGQEPPGHDAGSYKALTPEQERARINQMRADLEAMVRSRRARGIPPEGVLMPGEFHNESFHLQRPMPGTSGIDEEF